MKAISRLETVDLRNKRLHLTPDQINAIFKLVAEGTSPSLRLVRLSEVSSVPGELRERVEENGSVEILCDQ